ncbi:hypothetical protein NO2_1460 [Candidatus Termititenax persephonae]|uniref:Uncharacterized protein n=1 Tax=Candidatus Termititenax persephonae TaxID=2218525 RepID=A0A388TIG5_9BACT|nr:hypothetical protein NO2_1460 [Candidatus Termititenax persephonae]
MKRCWFLGLLLVALSAAAKLELAVDSVATFRPGRAITRFVNLSPDKLMIAQTAPDTLTIRARRKIGAALVYYWTDQEATRQEVLTVRVLGRSAAAAPASAVSGKNKGNFQTYFKFDPANQTPVNKKMILSSLAYSADAGTLGWDFYTRYRHNAVSDKEDRGQLETLTFNLHRGPNHLTVGDTYVKYSELLAPYLEMQGLTGQYSFGALRLDGFLGKRPGNYWGSAVGENYIAEKDKEVDLGGGRLVWLYNDNLDFAYAAASRRAAPEENILGSYYVQSGAVNYRWDNYRSGLELASSGGRRQAEAARTELSYDTEKYGWQITYRDVAPGYRALADYFNYTGVQGWTFYGSARPVRSLSLSGSYEAYLQRFDREYTKLTNPDYDVERLRLRLGLDRVAFFRPVISYYANYRETYRANGFNAQVSEIEILRRRLWAYYDFSTWKYESLTAEYFNDRGTTGLKYRRGWFSYRVEKIDERTRYLLGGTSYGTTGWNLITGLGEFKLPSNFKVSLSHWYQARRNTLDTLDKNRNSLRLALGQSLGDLYWYLNGVCSREKSLFYEYEDEYGRDGYFYHDKLTQSEVSGGLVYKF